MVLRRLISSLSFFTFVLYHIFMIEYETLVFCNRQVNYLNTLSKLHIAKLVKCMDCFDPLTGKLACKRVLVEVPTILGKIFEWLLEIFNDKAGKEREEKLFSKNIIKRVD